MAAVKGEVAFDALGQRYVLLLDFNALCDLEDDLPGLMDGSAEVRSPKAIRAVFAAGLKQQHPDVDLLGAGRIIQDVGIERAGELVGEAFEASFGGASKTASPQKARPSSGAGSAP